MKRFTIKSWSTATRVLVLLFVLLALCVVFIGLDNVPGLVLGMAAAATLILEFTRRWRRIRRFVFLAGGSFLAAIILSGLYAEVALPLAERIGGPFATESTGWLVYHAVVSYGIFLIVPGCIVIGMAGAFVLAIMQVRAEFRNRGAPAS